MKNAQLDELKHDDECPTCLRTRNGMVGRNSVRRPDGVITFGSPFVSFERRSGGLLTARLSAWVFRFLVAIPFAILIYLVNKTEIGAYKAVTIVWGLTPPFLKTILLLTLAASALLAGLLLSAAIARRDRAMVRKEQCYLRLKCHLSDGQICRSRRCDRLLPGVCQWLV